MAIGYSIESKIFTARGKSNNRVGEGVGLQNYLNIGPKPKGGSTQRLLADLLRSATAIDRNGVPSSRKTVTSLKEAGMSALRALAARTWLNQSATPQRPSFWVAILESNIGAITLR